MYDVPRSSATRRGFLGAGLALGLVGCTSDGDPGSAPEPVVLPVREVAVSSRATWGAELARSGGTPHEIERLTVHHSAYRLREGADPTEQLRALQAEHLDAGWPDIAYHFLLDLDGRILQGRDPAVAGDSFTPYDTTGHLQVCLLGHFDRQDVGAAQAAGLSAILAWGAHHYEVGTATIAGHGDHEPSTICPGRRVDRILRDGSLVAEVDDLLATTTPTLVVVDR